MPLRNYTLEYRPLRPAVQVINPMPNDPGTLGCFATSDGTDRWLLSCYHVLCRPSGAPFAVGEPVYQPFGSRTAQFIARVMLGDPQLDCAAALVEPGFAVEPRILGMPRLNAPALPAPNMDVIKSGMATGVTEGRVLTVQGAGTMEIVPRAGYPGFTASSAGYAMIEPGDSGEIWVDANTLSPVAMHVGDFLQNWDRGRAMSLVNVLATLGLRMLI